MPDGRAVALAGSAGSIDALKSILGGLPRDLPAPVFVLVHVGASGLDLLAQIFDATTPLDVTTAREGCAATPGSVYVAPADHHLLVLDGTIRLGRGPRENMCRPAIDPLFRSVGLSYGAGAIGVLLSGYLNDGAAGLVDLQRCGGISVVQNPADAEASEMPYSALRASDVDYRAPAKDIPDLVNRLLQKPVGSSSSPLRDVALEVDIALGRPVDSHVLAQITTPSTLTCPGCGGVLSQHLGIPLRYRCQVGHAYTGEILAKEQDVGIDEAVRVALRIVEARATLTETLAAESRASGRSGSAADYDDRARELRSYAETLRRAALGAAP